MYEYLQNWVASILGEEWVISSGVWNDDGTNDNQRFAAIMAAPGLPVLVDVRRPRYKVLLVGRRNEQSDAAAVMAAADTLVQVSMEDFIPCSSMAIQAMSEPTGPGYTTENRAWASVEFKVTF